MANLWEIDSQIMNSCIDTDTGEIIDEELLNQLEMEREKKLENIAKWIRNLESDVDAFKQQEKTFSDRRKSAEKKIESLKSYLSSYLDGQKWSAKDNSVMVSFRKSERVDIDADFDESNLPKEFLKAETTYKAKKDEIKKAIKSGILVEHCSISEHYSINVK